MRKIEYTDIEIFDDPRIVVAKKVLSGIISKVSLKETIVVIMPDNTMIAINQLSIIYVCNLKECIPGYTIFIDNRTFNDEYIVKYDIQENEYIAFNQSTSGLYLNIADTCNKYYYNINTYSLIDKIEDITSYQYYINLKADDGSKFFRGYNNSFMLPVFTKFPNISKSDTANLYVYNLDSESNLVVWKIYKKKFNRDVYTIFRVMKLLS